MAAISVNLAELRRLAREYDAIEPGAAYPAVEFVDYLRAELLAVAEQRADKYRERRREYMRGWRARVPG